MKRNVTFFSLFVILLATLTTVACTSQNSPDPVPESSAPTESSAPGSQSEPKKEKQVVLTSERTFSGGRRPVVVQDRQYLSETALDQAQDGKIVYTVNSKQAGYISGSCYQTAGQTSQKVRAIANKGYKFVRWSDGNTNAVRSGDTEEGLYTAIFDYDVLDMPIVSIQTQNGKDVRSKTDYIEASFSLLGCAEKYQIDAAPMLLRGRGNNSWSYEKKSYKFKLDQKENLLDLANGRERIWVLLANHCDQSLMRNHVCFELGRYFRGIDWEPASTSVEVFLNGEYIGVYLLAEDIKVSGDRVDIQDTKPDEIDTGYLLELSNYASGEVIHAADRSYMLHSDLSENDDIRHDQKKFIQNYVDDAYQALCLGSQADFEQYVDIDSFVASYLVEEISKNLDSQWDSFYMHKDAGEKLHFGPLWDFDLSLGNANEGAEYHYDIYVGEGRGSGGGSGTWFAVANEYTWFRQLVADKWAEIYDSIVLMPSFILQEGERGFRSYERNFERWPIFGKTMNRETHHITDLSNYKEHYEYLAQWLSDRIAWLDSVWKDPAYIQGGISDAEYTRPPKERNHRYGNDAAKEIIGEYQSLYTDINQRSIDGPNGFSDEDAENAFDSDKDTKYCVDINKTDVLTFSLKEPKTVAAYVLQTANDTEQYTDRNPGGWMLYGSSDGRRWKVISKITDSAMEPKNHTWYGYKIAKPKPYQHYKFVFDHDGTMQLSEIELFEEK